MKVPFRWKQWWIRFLRLWQKFIRKANLKFHFLQDELYEIDRVAYPYLRIFNVILSVLVIVSILIPIGFELTPELVRWNRRIETWILLGFALNYLLRLALTSDRTQYLKKRWFEGVITISSLLLLADLMLVDIGLLSVLVTEGKQADELFLQLLKGYLLLIVVIKVLQFLPELLSRQKNTARFLVYSFLALIAAGTFLLMLPGATQDGEGLLLIDALFTSTSAVCVTGLIVVDTATHFTLFGELVILTLIQLGGIGIITFATFLFLYISGGLGVGQLNTIKDMVGERNASVVSTTLKRIVGVTFTLEAIGVVCYYFSWTVEFPNHGQRILFSVFHAISAFCNAGFSLFTNSLADAQNAANIGINVTTMVLIVLGGLGFTVIWELIRYRNPHTRWRKRLSIHTRTVLVTSAVLIVAGTLLILTMEWSNTLSGYSFGNKLMLSMFQSITTRTAGFNTLDTGAIGISATLVMMLLMVIGGSPASSAGGIKTTTFAVLMRSITMTVKGYGKMLLFKRTIPNSIIFRAITVLLLASACIGVSTILLTLVEDHAILDLLFEEISAFATVGLSRGITGDLTSWGKFIIVVSMFLGRVGILTFMVAFAEKVDTNKYQYPEENIMVS